MPASEESKYQPNLQAKGSLPSVSSPLTSNMRMISSKRIKDMLSLSHRWAASNGLLLGGLHRCRDRKLTYRLLSKEVSGVSLLRKILSQLSKNLRLDDLHPDLTKLLKTLIAPISIMLMISRHSRCLALHHISPLLISSVHRQLRNRR